MALADRLTPSETVRRSGHESQPPSTRRSASRARPPGRRRNGPGKRCVSPAGQSSANAVFQLRECDRDGSVARQKPEHGQTQSHWGDSVTGPSGGSTVAVTVTVQSPWHCSNSALQPQAASELTPQQRVSGPATRGHVTGPEVTVTGVLGPTRRDSARGPGLETSCSHSAVSRPGAAS